MGQQAVSGGGGAGTAPGRSVPPSPTLAAPAGQVLGGRYRLDYPLPRASGAPSTLWHATDTVLARPVAVRILAEPEGLSPRDRQRSRERFVAAAVEGGKATHPGLAAVLDTAVEPAHGPLPAVPYAVVRWVDAAALSQLLRKGPLTAERACHLATSAAHAVAALHASGIPHGRLHPGNILVGVDDEVIVTDAVVASVLHDDPDPVLETDRDRVAADTRALGWVLHAILTGYWAGPPAWGRGLPSARRDPQGALIRSRERRAGLSKALGSVVTRAVEPQPSAGDSALRTPAALISALAGLDKPAPSTQDADQRPARDLQPIGPVTRQAVRVGLIVAIAASGWLLGYQIGKVPSPKSGGPALPPVSAVPTATTTPPTAGGLALRSVSAFDPSPGDGSENNQDIPLALDSNPATGWRTAVYTGSPRLGGLKTGVGLLVDTGHDVSLSSVQLALSDGGTDIELRAAPAGTVTAPVDVTQTSIVDKKVGAAGQGVALVPPRGLKARFWIVWITRLPAVTGGYQAEVDELAFLP